MGVLLKYEDQSRAYHTDDEHNGKAGLARFFDLDRHDKQRSVYKQEQSIRYGKRTGQKSSEAEQQRHSQRR